MRAAVLAILFTLAAQSGTDKQMIKAYKLEECEQIYQMINFLLVSGGQQWDLLEKQPKNKMKPLEISWSVDLAANYTSIDTAFCDVED